jgi:hypothetical protein
MLLWGRTIQFSDPVAPLTNLSTISASGCIWLLRQQYDRLRPIGGQWRWDLITQYFLLEVLGGASLGRAALAARQRFVQQTAELDPFDLKTLGQFNLLGDPSVHPAVVPSATGVPKSIDAMGASRQSRIERRVKLMAMGQFLESTKPTASQRARKVRKTKVVQEALANIAREANLREELEFNAFVVKRPAAAPRRMTKASPMASRYYVTVSKRKVRGADIEARRVAIVAREVSGRIVGYRVYTEK